MTYTATQNSESPEVENTLVNLAEDKAVEMPIVPKKISALTAVALLGNIILPRAKKNASTYTKKLSATTPAKSCLLRVTGDKVRGKKKSGVRNKNTKNL